MFLGGISKLRLYYFRPCMGAGSVGEGASSARRRLKRKELARITSVDTPSPEGRSESLGEDDVERIVLTALHWGERNGA